MVILDATAGNRLMWSNRNPPLTVFLDRETRLKIPPDIIADNTQLPFRHKVFSCVIFDPPHAARGHKQYGKFKNTDPTSRSYYGWNVTKIELFANLHKAQKEFQRVTDRLCLKWAEIDWSLWKILPFFKDWEIIQKKEHKNIMKRGKNITWWVTMVLSARAIN